MPVADRFHLVALANDMLTEFRQRVIRESCGRRGRKSDPAWAARRRLLSGHERLRPESLRWLLALGRPEVVAVRDMP